MKIKFRKVVTLLIAFIMCFTFTGGFSEDFIINVSAEATNDPTKPFGYDNADVFVSECILGRATDADGAKMGFEQVAYKPVLWDYTYRNIAEAIIEDEGLVINSVFWKNVGYCLNGDFVNLATWKQVMYETLIMDWLMYQFESEEFQSEFEKDSAKYTWKLTKTLLKDSDVYTELGDMSVEDAMNLLDDDFYAANEILGKAKDFNNMISSIQTVASSGADFYKKFSKALAVKEACQSRIDFLNEVKAVTEDTDLINAISVVTNKINMSYGELAFNEGGFVMLKTVCNQTWGLIMDEVKIPGLKAVQLGKAGLDWIFNSDDAATKRMQVVILYMINSDFTKAYQKMRDTNYMSNLNENTALDFNNSFLCYVNYQAYASYITESYIAEALLEGAGNALVNLFSSKNINTYNDLKGKLDSNILTSKGWYGIVGTYYNLYNNIAAKNEEMSWYDGESTSAEVGAAFTIGGISYKVLTATTVSVYDAGTANKIEIPAYVNYKKQIYTVTKTTSRFKNAYELYLPETIQAIENLTGEKIDKLSVAEDNPFLFSYNNVVYDKNNYSSVACPKSLTEISVPNGVKIITNAFSNSDNLIKITLPESVDIIEAKAFYKCTNLISIEMPKEMISIGEQAFYECASLRSIIIPDGITTIESKTFTECTSLQNIYLPSTLQNIEYQAFYSCKSLGEIQLNEGLQRIGDQAFYECGLKILYIPKTVIYIYCNNNSWSILWGISSTIKLVCYENSYAHRFAEKYDGHFKYELIHDCYYKSYVSTPVTCTEDGVITYECTCGDTYTRPISSTGHIFGTPEVVPVTCGQDGYTLHTCEKCGYSYKDTYVTAQKHNYELTEKQEPSCGERGFAVYTCSECDASYTEILAATGHDYTSKVVAPTCDEQGYTLHTCGKCGTINKDKYVDALGHDYTCKHSPEVSCSIDGVDIYTCKTCKHTYSETIKAIGHEYADIVFEPDCTNKGYTKHVCKNCNYTYNDSYTSALGHKYEDEIVNAGCTSESYTRHVCSTCGHTQIDDSELISAHNYTYVIVQPTCLNNGYTLYECQTCGDSYKTDIKKALGHAYKSSIMSIFQKFKKCLWYLNTTLTTLGFRGLGNLLIDNSDKIFFNRQNSIFKINVMPLESKQFSTS